MEEKEPLDYHCFEVWRYQDGSFDLNVKVHEGKFNLKEASDAAMILSRCMREDIRETQLVYCVELYNDGQTSSHWREDDDLATNLREFLWAKRALNRGTYGVLLPFPKMPAWMINCLSLIEYSVALIWRLYVKITGRDAGYTVFKTSSSLAAAPPPGTTQEASEELATALDTVIDHKAGNVVWVQQWRRSTGTVEE